MVPKPTVIGERTPCYDQSDWVTEWYPSPIPEHVKTGCDSCYFKNQCLIEAVLLHATSGVWAGLDFSNRRIRKVMRRSVLGLPKSTIKSIIEDVG